MRRYNDLNYYQVFLLVLSLAFFTSCVSQNTKNNPREGDKESNQSSANSSSQGNVLGASIFNKTFQDKNDLPDLNSKIGEYVREIFQDKNGNIWFGTLARGVARYDGDTLVYFSTEHGLADSQVNGIAEDTEGNLWFATTNGVSKYDPIAQQKGGKAFTNFRKEEGLSDNSTWSILVDSKGKVWVGTVEGVSRMDTRKNEHVFTTFPLPETDIKEPWPRFSAKLAWEIIEDSNGSIWFGTDGLGVFKYDVKSSPKDKKSFTHFTRDDGLNTNNVRSILEDKSGNFWFGSSESRVPEKDKPYSFVDSNDGGLSRMNIGAGEEKTFTQFPKIRGLKGKDIGPIYEDQFGDIWIASKHNGVYRFDGKSFTNIREEQGIAYYNCAQSILEDKTGNLWVGFSGGLFRLNGESLLHITKDGPWR